MNKGWRTIAWVSVIGLVVVAWLVLVWLLYANTLVHGTGNNNAIDGLTLFPRPGREHRAEHITYEQNIPVGGPHSGVWQNCGIYDEPIREENVVSSLERGAIWLAYRPDLPSEQTEYLRDLLRQEHHRFGKPFLILAPKPGLDETVVVTAWQMQLTLDEVSDDRLVQFLRRYQKSPFAPESGADCIGGVGQPSVN